MTKRLNIKHKGSGVNPNTCTLGPAKILRPLRYIKYICEEVYIGENGEKVTTYREPYPMAEILAAEGNGSMIHKLARSLA
jgi:hypothetical protein